MEDTTEHIAFLARSTCRVQILKTLSEQEAADKQRLRSVVAGSRTTLQRNLNALDDRGWITHTGTTYSLTPSGELVIESFLPLITSVRAAMTLDGFLRWVPETDFDLDLHTLADATVIVADSANPYAPVNRHVAALEQSSHARLVLPVVGLQPLLVTEDRVTAGELTMDCVVSESAGETLRSDAQFLDSLRAHADSGNLECRTVADSVPYYLGVFDHCVQIGVEDTDGMPRALAETDAPPVREWATETFTRYKSRATPLFPADDSADSPFPFDRLHL